MDREIFRELGFSERETKVYLALLELSSTTVGPLAARTRIRAAKVYPVLDRLVDKGLVTFVIKAKTKYYEALPPTHILESMKERERDFAELLPDLEKLHERSKEQQIARVYEGFKAIKALFNSIADDIKRSGYYYVFASTEIYRTPSAAARFLRQHHIKMCEKRADNRLIAHESIRKPFTENYSGIKGIKFRFTKIEFPTGLVISGDRIVNWMWGERPVAFEIVSKQMAGQYKKFFLQMWAQSKK